MKIQIRAWKAAPKNLYSRFPLDMLRYDGSFIHDEAMAASLNHLEGVMIDGGPGDIIVLCVKRPGYTSAMLYPTIDRWASFGWPNLERVKDFVLDDPRQWNTVVGFTPDCSPILLTLQDLMDSKSNDVWFDLCYKARKAKGVR